MTLLVLFLIMYHCILNLGDIHPYSFDSCDIVNPPNDLVVTICITVGHVISKIETYVERKSNGYYCLITSRAQKGGKSPGNCIIMFVNCS